MNFQEALKVLGIEDYGERIFSSNSHGELFHIQQYIYIAKLLNGNVSGFREWFEGVVKYAENNWERPESVFQHVYDILIADSKMAGNKNI